jgi:UDP-sulfoquinovose synthase
VQTDIQDNSPVCAFPKENLGLRVTDLIKGSVYGFPTDEADLDHRLMLNSHYDEIFGTVLNRIIVQAITGYSVTFDGNSTQTRIFLKLKRYHEEC